MHFQNIFHQNKFIIKPISSWAWFLLVCLFSKHERESRIWTAPICQAMPPNAYKSQGWAKLHSGPQNYFSISHIDGREVMCLSHDLLPQCRKQESDFCFSCHYSPLLDSMTTGFKPRHSDVEMGVPASILIPVPTLTPPRTFGRIFLCVEGMRK